MASVVLLMYIIMYIIKTEVVRWIHRNTHKITKYNQFCLQEQIIKNSTLRQASPCVRNQNKKAILSDNKINQCNQLLFWKIFISQIHIIEIIELQYSLGSNQKGPKSSVFNNYSFLEIELFK